jgi:hypothetical protein
MKNKILRGDTHYGEHETQIHAAGFTARYPLSILRAHLICAKRCDNFSAKIKISAADVGIKDQRKR